MRHSLHLHVELPLSIRKEFNSSYWQLIDGTGRTILDKLPEIYDAWSIAALCNKFKDLQSLNVSVINKLYNEYKDLSLHDLNNYMEECFTLLKTNPIAIKGDLYCKLIILVFIHARKNNIELIEEFSYANGN